MNSGGGTSLALLASIALFGAMGAVCRYAVTVWAEPWGGPLPLGTALVNLAGSFLLALLAESALGLPWLSASWRLAIGTGFLGALTTYSTFSFDTIRLMAVGRWTWALANVAVHLVLGLGAAWAGFRVGRML